MKINTRSITLAATLTALCAVSGFAPGIFFLPVMVAATTLSVGMTAFVGLAFGCISLAYSVISPSSPVAVAFVQAPYLAIIPRVLAALGAVGMYKLLVKLIKPQKKASRFGVMSAGAAVGSLLNTAIVVTLLVLILPNAADAEGKTVMMYVPFMLISGAIECVCMAALVPPISLTLEKVVLKRKKAEATKLTEPTDGETVQPTDPTASTATAQAEVAEDNAAIGDAAATPIAPDGALSPKEKVD